MTVPATTWATIALLGYVTLQRLGELVIARRNTRRLLREGGVEIAASHYGLIVAVHATWLASLWVFAFGRPIHLALLALFVIVQLVRFWTLASIGRRWTTRIIVVPGETLVRRGPYRFVRHPNYLVVITEIALLPCVFGLFGIAAGFSVLNALVLSIRIPAEAKALGEHTTRSNHLADGERRSA